MISCEILLDIANYLECSSTHGLIQGRDRLTVMLNGLEHEFDLIFAFQTLS